MHSPPLRLRVGGEGAVRGDPRGEGGGSPQDHAAPPGREAHSPRAPKTPDQPLRAAVLGPAHPCEVGLLHLLQQDPQRLQVQNNVAGLLQACTERVPGLAHLRWSEMGSGGPVCTDACSLKTQDLPQRKPRVGRGPAPPHPFPPTPAASPAHRPKRSCTRFAGLASSSSWLSPGSQLFCSLWACSADTENRNMSLSRGT